MTLLARLGSGLALIAVALAILGVLWWQANDRVPVLVAARDLPMNTVIRDDAALVPPPGASETPPGLVPEPAAPRPSPQLAVRLVHRSAVQNQGAGVGDGLDLIPASRRAEIIGWFTQYPVKAGSLLTWTALVEPRGANRRGIGPSTRIEDPSTVDIALTVPPNTITNGGLNPGEFVAIFAIVPDTGDTPGRPGRAEKAVRVLSTQKISAYDPRAKRLDIAVKPEKASELSLLNLSGGARFAVAAVRADAREDDDPLVVDARTLRLRYGIELPPADPSADAPPAPAARPPAPTPALPAPALGARP